MVHESHERVRYVHERIHPIVSVLRSAEGKQVVHDWLAAVEERNRPETTEGEVRLRTAARVRALRQTWS